MEYKRLGLTDLKVSRLGFGCWAIGGHGYGHVDDHESIQAIHAALDFGINLFDTADVYGFGHSEEILAQALGARKKEVIIATKFGLRWDKNSTIYKDISPRYIVSALENSLKRLAVDCITVYQIHWPDEKTPIEDVMETLEKCRDAGKILHIGCCNFSKDLLLEVCNNYRIELYQCLYNVAKRRNADIITYVSEDLKCSIMAYSVIGRGIFAGKYHAKSKFAEENDTRSKDPDFHGGQYRNNIVIAQKLREIGEKYGKSPAQVAIRWVLNNPDITAALVGIKNREQLSENVSALGWTLDNNDLQRIDSIVPE